MKNKIVIETIFLLLILSIASWMYIGSLKNEKSIANIYQNGVIIKSIDLSKVDKSYEFDVEGENGGSNTIKIENCGISITCSDCPDEICINTGVIKDGVVPIVCLPNKLLIKIESEQKEDFDSKTF